MILYGFELIKEQDVPELKTKARLFRHVQTGAQLLSMENDDENKVFGVTFRTPPSDSTGVPHIMEHAVLNGSRKYPVKAPFDEMAKGSLKTFINAMTAPDKTLYPVASQNLQDFYNLTDVYLDAVFHARIAPDTLAQEGWHYELHSLDQPLIFKGVVFNEMKGAYSSPDSALGRYAQQSLFPDNTYGFSSGGDPKQIPALTYEQFKLFYETYYHPSNARIYFYGDDSPDERLRILNEYLKDYQRAEIKSDIPLQPHFAEPQRLTRSYDAGKDASGKKRGMTVVSWLLPEPTDAQRTMTFEVLTHILIGTPASPLRKALIDSKFGEELAGGGLMTSLRQMYFSIGLKGIDPQDAGKVEDLILQTLESLAQHGIDSDLVEAALNTLEFRLRENNTGMFPRGLSLMFRTMTTWIYDADPLALIAFEKPLTAIKQRLTAGEPLFVNLLREHFLQNTHRTTLVLEPDPELGAREEAEEKAQLARIRATMSEDELKAVIERTRQLKRIQETPDSPEALATIPILKLSDLEKRNKIIPLQVIASEAKQSPHGQEIASAQTTRLAMTSRDAPILYHDLSTNGIVYLDLGFNLQSLPQELLPYVSLFGRALLEMGTEMEDYTTLALRISRKTGGIGRASLTSWLYETELPVAWMFLRGKATTAQADELLAILHDVLLTVKLDNPERFLQMVLQEKARQEAGIVPAGNFVASQRLKSHFNVADWAAEQMGGVSYLFFLRELSEAVQKDWPSVLERLETIRRILINRSHVLANITLDADHYARFAPKLSGLLATLPTNEAMQMPWSPPNHAINEGLTIPSKVNYVAKGDNLYRYGYQPTGAVSVVSAFLSRNYVRERVRVQGGAYGGACSFDRHSGIFSFTSYRDPNLLQTLKNYDEASAYLRHADVTEDELTKIIVGVIGQVDAYLLPDAKGYTSMVRYLLGDTDEKLQKLRDEVLGTRMADLRSFADVLAPVGENGLVVALGSPEAIEAANDELNGWLKVNKVI